MERFEFRTTLKNAHGKACHQDLLALLKNLILSCFVQLKICASINIQEWFGATFVADYYISGLGNG